MYVVTKYWNNGEPWCDNHHNEVPIAVFDTVEEIIDLTLDFEVVTPERYDDFVMEVLLPNGLVDVDCPIDLDWYECDMEYDVDYCENCVNTNNDNAMDFSSETLRVYKVDKGELNV